MLRTRAREVDVDRGQPLRRLHGCPAKLDLLRAEAAKVGPELGGALAARVGDLAKRGFEPLDLEGQGGDKPVGARRDPPKHGGIGVHAGRPRGRGGRSRCRCRLGGRPSGVLGPGCQLFDLDGESTAPGLQLEQDGLGRLTREPELAANWIPADALGGHGRHGRGEQVLDRDHRQLRDELTWIAVDQDDDGPEPCRPDPLDELERPRGVVREHRGSSMAERRSDGALGAGVDVEQGEGEPLPGLGELASRRWQSFALGQRLLECPQTLTGEVDAGRQVVAQALRLIGGARELSRRRACRPRTLRVRGDRGELRAEPRSERLGGLATHHDALRACLQLVQRRGRPLAAAGGVGELLLGLRTRCEQRLQLRVELLPRRELCRALLLRRRAMRAEAGEIERGDRGLHTCDLLRKLRGAFGRGRLERERAQALLHLVLEIAGALDLDRDSRKLELGPVPAQLEAAETGCLLDERAPFGRLRAEHGLDTALRDDRPQAAAEADVREKLDQVEAANRGPVHEVLPLAAAVQPARERHLRERKVGPGAVLVVEDQLDLAEVRGLAARGPGEENVVGLLGAQLVRAQRSRRPEDRIGDVRLPRAVRSDDDRDARLEAHLDRVHERLEPTELDRLQVHARRSLPSAADTAPTRERAAARARRAPRGRPLARRPSSSRPCRLRPARRRSGRRR